MSQEQNKSVRSGEQLYAGAVVGFIDAVQPRCCRLQSFCSPLGRTSIVKHCTEHCRWAQSKQKHIMSMSFITLEGYTTTLMKWFCDTHKKETDMKICRTN